MLPFIQSLRLGPHAATADLLALWHSVKDTKPLGRGTYGTVYAADVDFGDSIGVRRLALKMSQSADPDVNRHLQHEAVART